MSDWPNDEKLSALNIRRACEKSLRRLQTDYIDLYQMHHVDRDSPWDEIWQGMETLVVQGKVVYIGSSNFAAWHIARANEIAQRRNFLGLVSEQSLYNLNARTVELEVLPACETYGLGVIPYSPLAGGLLGGIVEKEKGGRRNFPPVSDRLERNRDRIEAYETLCADAGLPPGVSGFRVRIVPPDWATTKLGEWNNCRSPSSRRQTDRAQACSLAPRFIPRCVAEHFCL